MFVLDVGRGGDLCEVRWPGGPSSNDTFPRWAAAGGSRLHWAGERPNYQRRAQPLEVSVCAAFPLGLVARHRALSLLLGSSKTRRRVHTMRLTFM